MVNYLYPYFRRMDQVDDADLKKLRELRTVKLPWGLLFVIAIPTAFAMLGETLGDMGLGFIIPSIWQIFVVCNILALTKSEAAFCLFYIMIGLFIAYYMGVFKQPKAFLKKKFWQDLHENTRWRRCDIIE